MNLRYRGRLLYSERGPALYAERLAAAAGMESGAKEPARLYILASPCLWHGVATFLEGLAADSALICLEAEPALADLARAQLPQRLAQDSRLRFTTRTEPETLLELASEMGAFRRAILVRLSGGAAFHEEAYRRATARLDAELIASWKNRGTLMALGRLWVRNTLANLASLEEIDPQPLPRVSTPILVCGAGPSLESALPLLERCRDRLFLIACDTALSPLFSAGFLPDLGVCLEGQAHNLSDFTALGRRGFPLLGDLSSHPASFRAIAGPKHLSLVRIKEGALARRLRALGLPALMMPPLGSVGVHALHIARLLAASSGASSVPILATGLDFAFEAGKTHARGSPALIAEGLRLRRLRMWPGQLGAAFRRGVSIAARPGPEGQSSRMGLPQGLPEGQSSTRGSPQYPNARLLSDPVLSGYAALAAEVISELGPPVYDIRDRGLPLGAPRLGIGEAEALIEPFGRERESPSPDAPMSDARGPRAGASELGSIGHAFLSAELARLLTLEAALKGRFNQSSPELLASIRDLDYLLWTAPDAERIRELPQDLLNRVLVETEYWIWKLGDILAAAKERHVLPSRL